MQFRYCGANNCGYKCIVSQNIPLVITTYTHQHIVSQNIPLVITTYTQHIVSQNIPLVITTYTQHIVSQNTPLVITTYTHQHIVSQNISLVNISTYHTLPSEILLSNKINLRINYFILNHLQLYSLSIITLI